MNLVIDPVSKLEPISCAMTSTDLDCQLSHRILGHIGNKYSKIMGDRESMEGLVDENVANKRCNICSLSKSEQLPYNNTRPRARKFLENVQVDLSGIVRLKGLRSESYYIMFCDDFSSYRHIYPLKSKAKSEVFETFRAYIALAERQTRERLKQFTLDKGGEFVNDTLGPELRELGIVMHTTAGYAPKQNAVAERGNQTVTIKARSMMIESGLPLKFWYQACSTAVFLTNRTITSAVPNNRTPFEVWPFRKPSIEHLKVFGCKAY